MAVTSRLLAAGHSDVGLKRVENEDRILMDAQRGIYLVVDGLGGHAAGERAARVAADIIAMRLARQTGTTEKRVREAFALASTEIFEMASRDPELAGMACVATLAVIEDDHVTVSHVGDSRLYLLEQGSIRKVTRDHSPVGEMEDAGKLPEDAAMRHPRRNEVYRDLGSSPHAPDDPDFIEIHEFDLPPAAALLLCSDGLTDQVPSTEIRRVIEQHAGDPQAGALALVAAANEAGGKDNVSVVLIETPRYAESLEEVPVQAAHPSVWRWRGFVLGLLTATVLLGALRPYLEQTTSGPRVRFGTVRPPRNWVVGPEAIRTISEAVDRAKAGDTISVSPGEYHENLHLRSGVALVSTEVHGARIVAAGIVVSSQNVRDARFTGFEIVGPGGVGLRIANSDLDVSNVKISGMNDAGVEIEGGHPTLEASVIEENPGTGIYVHGIATARIEHNVILNNGHGPETRPGVFVAGSATPLLFGNVITNNGSEQVWVSPFFNQVNLVRDNVIGPVPREGAHEIKVVTR